MNVILDIALFLILVIHIAIWLEVKDIVRRQDEEEEKNK